MRTTILARGDTTKLGGIFILAQQIVSLSRGQADIIRPVQQVLRADFSYSVPQQVFDYPYLPPTTFIEDDL